MRRENAQETAEALLPGLQYLAREALDAGLVAVAGIIGKAANDLIVWMHENKDEEQPSDLGAVENDRRLS